MIKRLRQPQTRTDFSVTLRKTQQRNVTMRKILLLWLLLLLPLGACAQARELPDFTELVEKQGPAVVNISTTQTARAQPATCRRCRIWTKTIRSSSSSAASCRASRPGQSPRELRDPLARLGLHHQRRRLHPDQRARRRRRRRDHRALTDKREFKAKVIGVGQAHRRRADQDRGDAACRRSSSAIRTSSRSANGCWRSARRSASRTP